MKILKNNNLYIQKSDIMAVIKSGISIPIEIFYDLHNNDLMKTKEENKYEFIKFDKKEEIDFFGNINAIIDYNVVNDFSDEEIYHIIDLTIDTIESITNGDNNELGYECTLLQHKIDSLLDLIAFRNKEIIFDLPEFDNKKLIKSMNY